MGAELPPFIVIAGPTAVGKSALAMRVADRLEGEIVNADAFQVYRGLDVGTGTPTRQDRDAIPHHLIDIIDPEEQYSAGDFTADARRVIAAIGARGRVPVVVGGSGLYLKALLEGLAPMPAIDPALRHRLEEMASDEGLTVLRRMLRVLDPETAAVTEPGDTHRTLRALEIVLSSGRPQSWWIEREGPEDATRGALCVALTVPRTLLYDRIEARVDRMFEAGWIAEVERLESAGIDPESPGFRAIGYRGIDRHLRGEGNREALTGGIVAATRRLAKRQLTWFRAQDGFVWLDARSERECVARVVHMFMSIWRDDGEAEDQHSRRLPVPESEGGDAARRRAHDG